MSKLDLSDETIEKLASELIKQNKEIVKSEFEKKLRDIKSSEDIRRYRVIDGLYLNDHQQTYTELSNALNADTKTLRRDKEKAVEELKIMTFGVDGINDMSK